MSIRVVAWEESVPKWKKAVLLMNDPPEDAISYEILRSPTSDNDIRSFEVRRGYLKVLIQLLTELDEELDK